jgi:hypothetical protein
VPSRTAGTGFRENLFLPDVGIGVVIGLAQSVERLRRDKDHVKVSGSIQRRRIKDELRIKAAIEVDGVLMLFISFDYKNGRSCISPLQLLIIAHPTARELSARQRLFAGTCAAALQCNSEPCRGKSTSQQNLGRLHSHLEIIYPTAYQHNVGSHP